MMNLESMSEVRSEVNANCELWFKTETLDNPYDYLIDSAVEDIKKLRSVVKTPENIGTDEVYDAAAKAMNNLFAIIIKSEDLRDGRSVRVRKHISQKRKRKQPKSSTSSILWSIGFESMDEIKQAIEDGALTQEGYLGMVIANYGEQRHKELCERLGVKL